MSGPERIWAMEWRQETRGKHLVGGYTETPAYQGCTEYIRADLHAAAIARAERAEADADRLRAILQAAVDAWDIHNESGDGMQGRWVSDAREALEGGANG